MISDGGGPKFIRVRLPNQFEMFESMDEIIEKVKEDDPEFSELDMFGMNQNSTELVHNEFLISLEKFFDSLEKNTKIRKLNMGFNDIENVDRISVFLERNKCITHFNLCMNYIFSDITKLCNVLKNDNILVELDLGCVVSHHEMPNICSMLKENKKLKTLKLWGNEIPLDGLSDALATNTSLTELDISECDLCKYDLQCLVRVLKDNKVLKILKSSINNFEDEDAMLIFELLNYNTTLIDIDISGCPTTSAFIPELCKIITKNKVEKIRVDVSYSKSYKTCFLLFDDVKNALYNNTSLIMLDIGYNLGFNILDWNNKFTKIDKELPSLFMQKLPDELVCKIISYMLPPRVNAEYLLSNLLDFSFERHKRVKISSGINE